MQKSFTELAKHLCSEQTAISEWLDTQVDTRHLPIYSSVDVRESAFKMGVVDTNLFPAGFNNICQSAIPEMARQMGSAIRLRNPETTRVLILCESHTRNPFYWSHVSVLQAILRTAGFIFETVGFFEQTEDDFVEVSRSDGSTFQVLNVQNWQKSDWESRTDFILLNHDLSGGFPPILDELSIPIYPNLTAGWHLRTKSAHFECANRLIASLIQTFCPDFDPWLLGTYFESAKDVSIYEDEDRSKLADLASDLFKKIQSQYKTHHIDEKPLIFLKANAGTYGMGVMAIEDPKEILSLNRKHKNKLATGKGSLVISDYILQEGIPSRYQSNGETGELVIYQIETQFSGSFFRLNSQKNGRDNLNSTGMHFAPLCRTLSNSCCDTRFTEPLSDHSMILSKLLARLAAVATICESKRNCMGQKSPDQTHL